MYTSNSNKFEFHACTWHIIIISILNRIGYVFMTVEKKCCLCRFHWQFDDGIRHKLRLVNIPLYEDAFGEVLFDVFYFEFSLLMCENKMFLLFNNRHRWFQIFHSNIEFLYLYLLGRLGQQFLQILEIKNIKCMVIFLKMYNMYLYCTWYIRSWIYIKTLKMSAYILN